MQSNEDISQPEPIPLVTPERHLYEERLWNHACQIGDVSASLREDLEALYAKLEVQPVTRLTFGQRKLRAAQELRYWTLHQQLQDVSAHEEDILRTLDRLDTGDATLKEVAAVLPRETNDVVAGAALSKRRKAIALQMQKLARARPLIFDDSIPDFREHVTASDPRRIASGRNQRHLRSARGVSVAQAEASFYYSTADTHGGKVRRPHGSGTVYVDSSGRYIRKR